MPGYGRSTKGLDRKDPFGDLAGAMLGLWMRSASRRRTSLGNSLAAPARCGWRWRRPDRVDRLVLLGPGGIDTSRSLPTEGLLDLLDYYSGEGPTREKFATVPAQGPGVSTARRCPTR